MCKKQINACAAVAEYKYLNRFKIYDMLITNFLNYLRNKK